MTGSKEQVMAKSVGSSRIHDKRGSNTDRRKRKEWMLTCEKFGGDGTKVACVHCQALVGYDEVQADRIIPGSKGGTYVRANVQPSCAPCNLSRSDDVDWEYTP
jgi:5-methylcytosine-specific restriction endonuclease McrA